MKNVLPIMVAGAAALAASGCTRGAEATPDTAKVTSSIRAQEAQWEKDYAAKDVNALAGHYADDAALAGPGDALATTDVDRRKSLGGLVTDPNLKLTFASDRIEVAGSGDLASSRGHYSLTMTDKATNKPVTSDGSFLTVYKKQGDGSWKAIEDFITPGPAPAAKS
ncbi:MAG: YybH family protein [Sphingomonas sp.]